MDQELQDYLAKQFKSVGERFDKVDERFDKVDERFDGVDKHFDGVEQRLEQVETGIRENRVLIEGLQDQIQLVAEGVATVDSKLETFRGEVAKEFKEVRSTMD